MAILYDSFLVLALLFVTAAIITGLNYGITHHPLTSWQNQFLLFPILYAVTFLFFGLFWTLNGQTLGMQSWNIKLVPLEGNQITWQQAIVRFLTATISFLSFGLGYIVFLFNKEKMTWHDQWSKTRLIFLKK